MPSLIALNATLHTEARGPMAIGKTHVRSALLSDLESRTEHLRQIGELLLVRLTRFPRQ